MPRGKLTDIFIKSATDPGVIFNIGNALMNAPVSKKAAAINLSMAFFCAGVRVASELRERGITLPLPKAINKFLENKGAALTTDGAFTIASGAVRYASDPSKSVTIPFMMASYGAAKLARGVSVSLKGTWKRSLDAAAIPIASLGSFFGMHDAPMAFRAMTGAIAGTGLYTYLKDGRAKGLLQPDLMAAFLYSTYGLAYAQNPSETAAFLTWSAAYLSLHKLKKDSDAQPPALKEPT